MVSRLAAGGSSRIGAPFGRRAHMRMRPADACYGRVGRGETQVTPRTQARPQALAPEDYQRSALYPRPS